MTQHTNHLWTGGRPAIAMTAVAMAAAIGLGGCSNAQNEAARTPGATAAASAAANPVASGSPRAGEDKTPTSRKSKLPKGATTKNAKPPLAPKVVKQVMRNGKKPHPTVKVKGGAKAFTKPIVYTDGLTLHITKMTQGKMTGHGPGVYPGRPVTNFYVTLTNGTKKKLTLGVVVMTVTYGTPARLAHAVYGPKSKDFAGVIKPGKSAKAVYGFSVPAADRNDVTMVVDLDGSHQLATFTGKVK